MRKNAYRYMLYFALFSICLEEVFLNHDKMIWLYTFFGISPIPIYSKLKKKKMPMR